jgi:hypothetical protein
MFRFLGSPFLYSGEKEAKLREVLQAHSFSNMKLKPYVHVRGLVRKSFNLHHFVTCEKLVVSLCHPPLFWNRC